MPTQRLDSLAGRLQSSMGDDSPYVVASKMALAGSPVSAQAIYQWLEGGEVKEANLVVFARLYGKTPAWLRYGVGEADAPRGPDLEMARLIREVPVATAQQTLDFLQFQLSKATVADAQQTLADYLVWIDRIKKDLDDKRNGDPPKK